MNLQEIEFSVLVPSTLCGKDSNRICFLFETRRLLDEHWKEFIFLPEVTEVKVSNRHVKSGGKEYIFICAVDVLRLKGCSFESYKIFRE